ncbi:MAG: peptide-methionine (S)-S-oxide reductase MsrA [Hyphomicrobiaceae bacterium]
MKTKHTLAATGLLIACALLYWWSGSPRQLASPSNHALAQAMPRRDQPLPFKLPPGKAHMKVATFAGGCFWCVEAAFEKVPDGVSDVVSGYTGGLEKNPGYHDVASGRTGHTEAVQLFYDPKVITYEGLLQVLFRTADPTDSGGQYHDRGKQYRPGIYYHDAQQKMIALAFRSKMDKSGRYPKPLAIEIEPYMGFYKAEDLHQDYAQKHPVHYTLYSYGSGRVSYQEQIWGKDLEINFNMFKPLPDGSQPEVPENVSAGVFRSRH